MSNIGQAIHIKKEILVRIIKAFLSDNFEEFDNTVTWIDEDRGIQFTIDGHIDAQAILDIANSVSLEDITKE